MLRRSPTMFGVLLSFAFFSGLLTLLLLAQRGIPDQRAVVPEPVAIDVGSPPIQSSLPEELPPQAGEEAPGSALVAVPAGPVVPILVPVGGAGPSDQEQKPGQGPGGGKPGEGPGGGPPSPPGGGEQPAAPGGGQQPPGGGGGQQPSPPPGVLPPGGGIGDEDDDGDGGDAGDGDDDTGDTPADEDGDGHEEDGESGDDDADD